MIVKKCLSDLRVGYELDQPVIGDQRSPACIA